MQKRNHTNKHLHKIPFKTFFWSSVNEYACLFTRIEFAFFLMSKLGDSKHYFLLELKRTIVIK